MQIISAMTSKRRGSSLLWSPLAVAVLCSLVAVTVAAKATSEDDGASDVRSVTSMDVYDGLALLFVACGLSISSAGGIGGGGIMVPAMVLIMGLDIKAATPISNMGILGGAVANTLFNMTKRHPVLDRPLIDADLSLMTTPLVIGGAVIGALLANLLPSYIISLLFLPLLATSGTRMLFKGLQLRKKERAARQVQQLASPAGSSTSYREVATPMRLNDDKPRSLSSHSSEISLRVQPVEYYEQQANAEAVAQIVESERHFSFRKHGAILLCYLIVVAASIADALVTCGGVTYWVLLLIEIPIVAVFAALSSVALYREYQHKVKVNYPFPEGDVRWTKHIVTWFPLGSAAAGLVAGLFGIGGVIITGPIMMELGVIPEVLAAASALMVLYSAAAATAKYAVFDMIAWDWAFLLCALAFTVTSCSQVFIVSYVRRTGKQSIIVLCIAATILIAMALMIYDAVRTTIDDHGAAFSVNVCD